MKLLTLAAAAALGLAALPAVAQPSDVGNMAYPNPSQTPAGNLKRTAVGGGRDVGNMAERTPGRPGYSTGDYGRRQARAPSDVGNMAFPDPGATPAGNLPAVAVTR